jgi:Uma2 family endonuclease
MSAVPRTTGIEEFLAMPEDGNRHEFVRGEVRSMPPPSGVHGKIEAILQRLIGSYLDDRARALGWQLEHGFGAQDRLVGFLAGGEFGLQFSLPDDPNQIRGADCVYVPAEQWAQVNWDGQGYFPAVPWLVIEVISPSDSAADIAEKVQDYLAGGARSVWCVYPQKRTIHVYSEDAPPRFLLKTATLTDDDILPGFAAPLAWIFN